MTLQTCLHNLSLGLIIEQLICQRHGDEPWPLFDSRSWKLNPLAWTRSINDSIEFKVIQINCKNSAPNTSNGGFRRWGTCLELLSIGQIVLPFPPQIRFVKHDKLNQKDNQCQLSTPKRARTF